MENQFSSVEAMLRWQIDLVRERASKLQDAFKECGELYPLPKPTDGLPENWGHAGKTHEQVALAHALDGLKWVFDKIAKAERALEKKDFPRAIFWVVDAKDSIWSTNTYWHSMYSVRTYRYVGKIREGKALAGSKRWRNKVRPTKEELLTDRDKYFADHGLSQGWLKQASRKFSISDKTINRILEED